MQKPFHITRTFSHLKLVGVNSDGLSLDALSRLHLAHDDGAHVGELVHDGHHEGALDVALQQGQGVDVRDERLVTERDKLLKQS